MSYPSLVLDDLVKGQTVTFFITEAGRLGLGSVYISPGDSIYIIYRLKTPFTLYRELEVHVLRGECYVNSLIDRRAQRSSADSFVYLR
jgi:hypothetical protein